MSVRRHEWLCDEAGKIELYHSMLTVLGHSEALQQKKKDKRVKDSQTMMLLDIDEAMGV